MSTADSRTKMLEEVRKRIKERQHTRQADPTEWQPPKVEPKTNKKYKFIVLPPYVAGDKLISGKAAHSMSDFYLTVGKHWVDNRPYTCPRVTANSECPLCEVGFSIIQDVPQDNKELRKKIYRRYLPTSYHYVNIYFPPFSSNPEDIRDKTFWWAISQKKLHDTMLECLFRDQADATGDSPDEAQAYGFFYLPDESYVFLMDINHQGGYNEYSQSKFLASTRGPLAKKPDGAADTKKILAILEQRSDLHSKFDQPNINTILELTKKLSSVSPSDIGDTPETTKEQPSNEWHEDHSKASTEPTSNIIIDDETPAAPAARSTKMVETATSAQKSDPELDALLAKIRNGSA